MLIFLSSASPNSESLISLTHHSRGTYEAAHSSSSSAAILRACQEFFPWIRHSWLSAELVFDRALGRKPAVGINLPAGIRTRVPLPINFIGLHVRITARGIGLQSDSYSTLRFSQCMCICHGEPTRPPTATTVIMVAAAMNRLLRPLSYAL